jgi:hypothetical protein
MSTTTISPEYTETRPDGTVVTYRYGVAFGEEVTNPYLARSSKRLVNAAIASGWHAEFTRDRGNSLHVHLTPKSPMLWAQVEEAGPVNPNGRRKWLAPARIDLFFDGDTGAYLGGTAFRTWEAPLKNDAIYSVLGETVADVQTYIEFPQKWHNHRIAEAKRDVERAAAQEIRLANRRAFLDDPDNHYAIAKLQEWAADPKVPNLQDERSPRDVLRAASTYATALVMKRLAESVLDRIGWTEEDGTVITVSAAISQAISEVSRSYEKNGAEVETLAAIAKLLDQYWGKAS